MRRKVRRMMHDIRVFFIKTLSVAILYIMAIVGLLFLADIICSLLSDISILSDSWNMVDKVIIMISTFTVAICLFIIDGGK